MHYFCNEKYRAKYVRYFAFISGLLQQFHTSTNKGTGVNLVFPPIQEEKNVKDKKTKFQIFNLPYMVNIM